MSGCGFGKPSSAQRVACEEAGAGPCCVERAVEAGARLAGRHAEQIAGRVRARPASRARRRTADRPRRARDSGGGSARRARDAARPAAPARRAAARRRARARSRSARRPSSGTGSPTSRHACCSAPAMIAVESASVPSQSKTTKRIAARLESAASAIGVAHRGARRSAASSGGERRLDDHLAAVDRMREANAARVQEHPLQALPARAPCSTRSRRTCRRPRAESRDASRCTRIWCVRPVSSSASSSASGGSASRPHASRAGRSSAPAGPSASTRTRRSPSLVDVACAAASSTRAHRVAPLARAPARRSACRSRRRAAARAGRSARARFLATSSTPDVSRSSRWTSSRNAASGRARAAARSRRTRCRCRRARRGPRACSSAISASSSNRIGGSATRPGRAGAGLAAGAPTPGSAAPAATSPDASRASGPTRRRFTRTSPLRRIR